MSDAAQDAASRRLLLQARLLFLAAAVVMVAVNCINLGNPILERHGFRQTQTALTAQAFLEHGFRLAYETPVLGEPWSIPFEFPLYQGLVALLALLSGASLTAVGRLLSLAFTLACCLPIHATLLRLGVARHASFVALAMFLTSPLYLFWAGTFLIESTALFCGLCFLYFAVRLSEGSAKPRVLAGCAGFLALALLQKVTTALPMLACAAVLVLVRNWRAGRPAAFWLAGAAAAGVPLLVAWGWVAWTDALKTQHPIAAQLTSRALSAWNYGLPEQRFAGELWYFTVFRRVLWPSSGMLLGLVAVAVAWRRADARLARVLLGLLALFLLPLLVFTNLHVVHDYYQVANAVFWSLVVGLSVALLMETARPARHRWPLLLAGAILLLNVEAFVEQYDVYKFRRIDGQHRTLAVTGFVRRQTPPELPVVWAATDWSSEFAFYSGRRSLTLPKWVELHADMLHGRRNLSTPPSAVVHCPTALTEQRNYRQLIARETGVQPVQVSGCEVYLLRRGDRPG